uniref:26S proteasome non-ATPase regulatory subunit 10 (inferred by orthology to a human protein) n=1 Tax=Anisakis simplex TaxID=6269 RepID=A0A0M3K386_ANISI
LCQQEILKSDISIKNLIENIKHLEDATQKQINDLNGEVKRQINEIAIQIDSLQRLSNKVERFVVLFLTVKSSKERDELLAQVKEHRKERSRDHLFSRREVNDEDIELRNRMKRSENLKKEAIKTTGSLSALVSRMNEQVKLSEESTTNLIHSSALLRETEGEYASMGSHIQRMSAKLKEVNDELTQLLRENKAESAKRLLQKHANLVSYKDDSGRTAVHWACSGGCLEIVQFCVSVRDEDAVSTDDMGWTPLMIASSAGRLEVVRYLVTLPNIDIDTANSNGQTALHYAASRNHAAVRFARSHLIIFCLMLMIVGLIIVSLLVGSPKLRIDIADSCGCSPLHLAIEEHREDVAIKLADRGANLYLENKAKQRPIDLTNSAEFVGKLKMAAKRFEEST